MIIIIIITIIGTGISLSFPYILKLLIDGIKTQLAVPKLLTYVGILLGLGVHRSLVNVGLPYVRGRTNELFNWNIRSLVFRHILKLGHSFTNKFPSGDIIERLDQDLGELSWFACSGVFRPLEGILTIIIALIILIKLNPLLTLISVLPVWLAVLVWLKLGPLVYTWYRAWREKISEANNHLESSFTGIKIIKSYCAEDWNIKRFNEILKERINRSVTVTKAEAKIGIFFSGIAELGILLILWVGGMFVIKQRLSLGSFVAFNVYILMLITPMFDIGNFFVAGRRAKAGEERIRELKDTSPDIKISPTPQKFSQWQSIEFKDVSFQYEPNRHFVLQHINLIIKPKMKIGIAGTVGSGKSTIIKLLLRICEPTKGEILLNDIDYRQLDLDQWRSLFGYAPQEASLFSDTIYNNIVWGRDKNIKNQIQSLTEITQLDEDIKTFPDGIQQQVGERGIRLSGGQKQKVALSRALFSNPEILILDDATSNLDAQTEQKLINSLTSSQFAQTLLIISHRLTLLSICDIIYCLDKGKIVETGTHQELLSKKGLYWKLYQRQILEKGLAIMHNE
ncbi:MAG: ABC transporter ATP-binding protein/permease [candidate division WOR-3 bacterium]|nr:ABC transporter ATP-binding protein/permease [candidate division WOR-3 bacterium]